MTLKEQFEKLHPDIIADFLKTGHSEAIPEILQQYILVMDRVPELQKRYPSVTTCAKELIKRYPKYNYSFHYARQIIYDAINYFHLNSTVRNEAWDNHYADRAEELHQICVKQGDLKTAGLYLEKAHEWRHNPNENAINPNDLKPKTQFVSPEVTAPMLDIDNSYNLKQLAGARNRKFQDAAKFIDGLPINTDEKASVKREAALAMNITDAQIVDGKPD